MKKVLVLASLFLLMIASTFALVETTTPVFEVGQGIDIGLEIVPACPEIDQSSVEYDVDTYADVDKLCGGEQVCMGFCSDKLEQGRSYAFEGETISFDVNVTDKDGILSDCVKVVVTLTQGQEDPIVAGCTLQGAPTNNGQTGTFHCTYVVQPAEAISGTWWASVQATDNCGAGCVDSAAGVFSLYLNPAVGLEISSQQPFAFAYAENGAAAVPTAGQTIYTPYFTVENVADASSGLYILLALYGEDMYADTSIPGPAPICPLTNVLDIKQVDYMADHLNVHQAWTQMPEDYAGRKFVFQSPAPFSGNFIGVGDDITGRLRLRIPSPCKGSFTKEGEIVFVGTVI